MKFSLYNNPGVLSALAAMLLLSACASSTPKEKAQDVEYRATQRWEKLLGGDLAGAYEYLSPGYRSSVSSTSYQRSVLLKRVRWTGAKYYESDCEETLCTLTFVVEYSVAGALPGVKSFKGSQEVKESWVSVDDVWYLIPKN